MRELQKKYKQLSSISDEWFPRIKKIFITSRFDKYDVIFTTNDEKVYGFGENMFAILGMESVVKISDPTVIEELCGKDIRKVVLGDRFMVALTESHELYTGGLCSYGRCGNGLNDNTINYCKPKKVFNEDPLIVDICCGQHYTVILTDKQLVYTFGSYDRNSHGRAIRTPTLISLFEFEKITSISCGDYHALALTQNGKVYAWGYNAYGQLGLKHDNEYVYKTELVEMPNNVSVKQISCGSYHSLLLTTDGSIYSCGFGGGGQLGFKNKSSVNIPTHVSTTCKIKEILAYGDQSYSMNVSNRIEFWGLNVTEEIILSPHITDFDSFQDALILCTKYPFTIEPIILKSDQIKKPNKAYNYLLSNRVMRTMAKGFNNPKNTDFQFKIKREEYNYFEKNCPSDNPNKEYDIIHCHKWFVEENCEHLKKMFANRKSVNETEIKGYSYETYFNFIQYLYTDSIETKDIETLNEMLLLSDMYSEEELKTRCVSGIIPLLNVENVCQFYSSAITNKSSDLEEYCFEFMAENLKSIVKTEGYEQLDPKIAKTFLKKQFEEQK